MRKTKHNANRHEAVVGGQRCKFDSMAEHRYAEWLERERRAKRIKSWEHHPRGLVMGDVLTDVRLFTMNVDFMVKLVGGGVEWHEVKGMATAVWRLKRRIVEAMTLHDYRVIDAGRGVCATGTGEPALFDDRPRKSRRKSPRKSAPKC